MQYDVAAFLPRQRYGFVMMTHGIATVSVRFFYGELRLPPITYVIYVALRCYTFPVQYDQDIHTIRNILSTFS